MIKRLIIDIKENKVFDASGHDLGIVGEVKMEINHETTKVYMTVNMIFDAANFRRAADAAIPKEKPIERAIRI